LFGHAAIKLLNCRHYIAGFVIWVCVRVVGLKKEAKIIPQHIKRVLIIANDEIGDFVLVSPFLREIRANFPGCEIHLVIRTLTRALAERCPYIDRLIVFDCGGGVPPFRYSIRAWRAFRLARRELRPVGFDLAIVPRWDVDKSGASALSYFSGARSRVAFSERVHSVKALINCGFDSFSTHVLESQGVCHEVERSFEILRFLGAGISDRRLEVWTDAEDEAFAEATLQHSGGTKERAVVAIAPGASEAKKRWPPSRFADVARELQRRVNMVVLLLGDKPDAEIAYQITDTLRGEVIDLVGKTTLRQTAALLRRSTIFIGNCSGPLHLAAAAGTAVVEISCHPRHGSESHSYSPKRFGPWLVPHVIVQPEIPMPPCTRACMANAPHCILSISVDQVAKAACKLLETTSPLLAQADLSP
jgi:ADP-heptose:LPS heptosyltransferase